MGGVYSTNNIEKHVYEDLLNKYNKMKSNYETEKIYSASLKENIEKLENKIVNNEIKIDSMEKDNEDNIKVCESIKSNYISKIINKDNHICELEDSIKYNDSIIIKNEKTIEDLRNKILKLNNENKNILYLENKLKIIEDSSKTKESTIVDLKNINIKYNEKNSKLEELNNELEESNNKLEEKNKKLEESNKKLEEVVIDLKNETNELSNNYIRVSRKVDSVNNIIKYFKNNKNQTINDILSKNNTIMPDFMEKNIIENVYNYIIEKIDILAKA